VVTLTLDGLPNIVEQDVRFQIAVSEHVEMRLFHHLHLGARSV
jgi:hypothetical protein